MASVPQLLDELCEAVARAGGARTGARGLRRAAFEALLAPLLQGPGRGARAGGRPRVPARSRALLLSFELRVAGLRREAERLEQLLAALEAAPAPAERAAALELLVLLAGSGPPRAPWPRRDPLAGDGRPGRAAPHGGYDCAGLSERERDVRAALARDEQRARDWARASLRALDAAPGSGLAACGRFSGAGRLERDPRGALFGALAHSRAWDVDVRLDLPPVPDGADLAGLAIKVPCSVDQSEDEGFQSASNLTPDSQSELGLTPDLDLWDAALTYKPSRRRCWERIGCPPGHGEDPYLTEAGRDAFDHFRRLHHEELQVLGGGLLDTLPPVLVRECELVKDVLNVLIGVLSATFSLCQLTQAFVVTRGTHVSGASPESVSSLLSEVAACGTHYMRLSHFSVQPAQGTCSRGLVFQAFTSGLRRYLQYYRACVLATPPTLSLLTIGFLFKKLGRQLRYLAELCGVGTVSPGAGGGEPRVPFPTGVKLLSYLYQEALDNCSNEHYPVLLSLLKASCEPYTRFIHDWVYSGVFRDVYGEFMIQVNHDYLGFRDKFYWTHGYVLISKEVEDCVPVFLKDIAHDVYLCGKTINLLKLCCPRHYLCWSEVPVPRISVLFSLEELRELQKACALYVGRMERVARHSSVSKEQKELRMEIAKQELIVHAWEAASRVLRELSDRQMSERMALDARKREQFQKLKEQFVKDQERRRAARQEELDDDFSYARELRDREKRLRALEEQLERTARQALVEHYSRLSGEAARREQRALWRVQRHRLASARLQFLSEDEKLLQGMLKDRAEGKEPPALTPLPAEPQADPPDGSPGSEQAAQHPEAASDGPRGPSPVALEPASGETCSPGPGAVPGPFSEDLSIGDFLPPLGHPEQSPCTARTPVLEEALQTIGSDLPLSPAGTPDYDFRTILRPSLATPASPGPFETAGGSLCRAGEQGGRGPEGQAAQCDQQQSRAAEEPLGNTLEGGDVKQGEAAGSAPSRPRWNVHGHVSDANIKVGEFVWDVAPSRPRWNVHGHVSQSQISLGVLTQEVQPERPAPHGSPCEGESHGLGPPSSDPGTPISDLGAAHPDPGAPASDLGAPHPELGAPTSDLGAQHSDLGELSCDLGAPVSDLGAQHSDLGALSCDLGAPTSDLGAQHPDLGAPVSDLGTQHAHPGAQHSDLGAQAPADSPWVQAAGSDTGCREEAGPEAQPGVLGDSVPKDAGKTGNAEDPAPGRPPGSQGGAAAQSSPGLGQQRRQEDQDEEEAEAAAAAQRREQAYIEGLAGQYRLEQYPDSFTAMSEPPVARLLHHGLPRACAPADGPREQPAAEPAVQLSELLPLPVLMKHSLTAPLAAHISLVNKAVVDYFFVELHLEAHLEALRHFLLMEDGEFAQSLSDLLFEKLGAGQTPGELLTPLVLNALLSKALQFSLHGHGPLAHNLSFALKFLPEAFAPNAPDVLSCLELRYKVDWPLNLVVTESCLGRYSGIFSFLLQLKLMMWTLKDVCFHLKRTALLSHVAGSVQFRQLQLFKHEMQHFVKVIQGYIANQILHVTWCEFRARLATVRDLEEVQRAHAEYLHKAVFRGLLTEKAAPVMNIIHSLFSLVLKFRSQLISQPWGPGPEHPNFALLQQSYNTFKYYSHFLFKVVTKLVNRGYQPHLEDFLLRINFNNYYQDARAGQ